MSLKHDSTSAAQYSPPQPHLSDSNTSSSNPAPYPRIQWVYNSNKRPNQQDLPAGPSTISTPPSSKRRKLSDSSNTSPSITSNTPVRQERVTDTPIAPPSYSAVLSEQNSAAIVGERIPSPTAGLAPAPSESMTEGIIRVSPIPSDCKPDHPLSAANRSIWIAIQRKKVKDKGADVSTKAYIRGEELLIEWRSSVPLNPNALSPVRSNTITQTSTMPTRTSGASQHLSLPRRTDAVPSNLEHSPPSSTAKSAIDSSSSPPQVRDRPTLPRPSQMRNQRSSPLSFSPPTQPQFSPSPSAPTPLPPASQISPPRITTVQSTSHEATRSTHLSGSPVNAAIPHNQSGWITSEGRSSFLQVLRSKRAADRNAGTSTSPGPSSSPLASSVPPSSGQNGRMRTPIERLLEQYGLSPALDNRSIGSFDVAAAMNGTFAANAKSSLSAGGVRTNSSSSICPRPAKRQRLHQSSPMDNIMRTSPIPAQASMNTSSIPDLIIPEPSAQSTQSESALNVTETPPQVKRERSLSPVNLSTTLPVKRERSPSPTISTVSPQPTTQGTYRLAPLPPNCQANFPGFKENRKVWASQERKKLVAKGLVVKKTIMRDDGLAFDWTSTTSVMLDTLLPASVFPGPDTTINEARDVSHVELNPHAEARQSPRLTSSPPPGPSAHPITSSASSASPSGRIPLPRGLRKQPNPSLPNSQSSNLPTPPTSSPPKPGLNTSSSSPTRIPLPRRKDFHPSTPVASSSSSSSGGPKPSSSQDSGSSRHYSQSSSPSHQPSVTTKAREFRRMPVPRRNRQYEAWSTYTSRVGPSSVEPPLPAPMTLLASRGPRLRERRDGDDDDVARLFALSDVAPSPPMHATPPNFEVVPSLASPELQRPPRHTALQFPSPLSADMHRSPDSSSKFRVDDEGRPGWNANPNPEEEGMEGEGEDGDSGRARDTLSDTGDGVVVDESDGYRPCLISQSQSASVMTSRASVEDISHPCGWTREVITEDRHPPAEVSSSAEGILVEKIVGRCERYLEHYFKMFRDNCASLGSAYTPDASLDIKVLPPLNEPIEDVRSGGYHGREDIIQALQSLPIPLRAGSRQGTGADKVTVFKTKRGELAAEVYSHSISSCGSLFLKVDDDDDVGDGDDVGQDGLTVPVCSGSKLWLGHNFVLISSPAEGGDDDQWSSMKALFHQITLKLS
ncbi:unnamed protein product [Somion occarium]|uniref:NTF2 domain-containing protein n=1 Tax=Somion occarium TaxID=3059160 RepID=A0ABP1E613_9APHY